MDIRDDGPGTQAWRDAGAPPVPVLVVDGAVTPFQTLTQLSSIFGLEETGARQPSSRLAADTVVLLERWLAAVRATSWAVLLAPTPSRSRSLRNLSVNVFHPFELLSAGWHSGRFDWDPDRDAEREQPLTDRDRLERYAIDILTRWTEFVSTTPLDDEDRPLDSPRGTAHFSEVLGSQRWHAAFHARQFDDVARPHDANWVQIYDPHAYDGLELPVNVY